MAGRKDAGLAEGGSRQGGSRGGRDAPGMGSERIGVLHRHVVAAGSPGLASRNAGSPPRLDFFPIFPFINVRNSQNWTSCFKTRRKNIASEDMDVTDFPLTS